MKKTLDPKNEGYISFTDIINYLLRRPKEQNIEDELMEAFLGFQNKGPDGNKSYKMSIKQLQKYLVEHGECFSENEAEKLQEFL